MVVIGCNNAGIRFYKDYKSRINDGSLSFGKAVSMYLASFNATDPSFAPNFDYIPHILDEFYAKSVRPGGLTGNDLYEAARAAFCKKPATTKQNKSAHTKIKYSANKQDPIDPGGLCLDIFVSCIRLRV